MKATYRIKRERVDGFTLIELLVVIVIIGILGAIAAPGWLNFLTRQRMNAVNSDLISLMREVQADAIQQRTDRQIELSSLGSAPSATVSAPDSGSVFYTKVLGPSDASSLQLAAFSLNPPDTWTPVSTTSPVVISFDYKGAISTTPSNITPPYIVKVEPQDSTLVISPKCVIVTTILGGLKPEQGDICNTFVP